MVSIKDFEVFVDDDGVMLPFSFYGFLEFSEFFL
jgi:hypothetical protein